ncbi:tigger transposable element-derived protein 6-like [Watersipora subatra]|uniref:tigger transposable element-derived protein 6-like n=1 Tax=Watersipora subatra TaxID=2589382 RepID=UPI00355C1A3B
MSGTEKEVPIVIGKFGKLRCFMNGTNLPCQYYHNKKAWMVIDIFQAWQVLQFTVDYIDTHGKKPDTSINVLKAIRWVHRAWNCVTKETIARCFHHGPGHTNLDETDVTSTVDDNEEGDTVRNRNLQLHTIDPTSNVTANELLAGDVDVTVAEHLSDAEIVQSVTSWGTLDDSDKEDKAEIVEPDPPTIADANNALDVLRRFIDTQECKDYNNCLKAISTLSYTVDLFQQNIFSQTTLDKFFK